MKVVVVVVVVVVCIDGCLFVLYTGIYEYIWYLWMHAANIYIYNDGDDDDKNHPISKKKKNKLG